MANDSQVTAEARALIGRKYGWAPDVTRQKIARTAEILQFSEADAVAFLAATIVSGPKVIICDGCRVQGSFEHRCHGSRAMVAGEQTGKPCQCLDCFVVNEIGLT